MTSSKRPSNNNHARTRNPRGSKVHKHVEAARTHEGYLGAIRQLALLLPLLARSEHGRSAAKILPCI